MGISINQTPVKTESRKGISINQPMPTVTLPKEMGDTSLGESQYDDQALTEKNLPYLNEVRASEQTGLDKFGNGLVKMSTSAFTGAAESTVGAAYGLLDAIVTHDASKLWQNDFTKDVIAPLQKWTDTNNPFYYNQNEQDSRNPVKGIIPFTEGSGNFWFDKVLGNAGYSLGALATGYGLAKLFKLGQLAAVGGEAALSEEAGAILEGKVLNPKVNWGHIKESAKEIGVGLAMAHGESAQEARSTYDEMIKKGYTEQQATDAANTNYLINLAITGPTDMFLMGKFINPGVKEAELTYNKLALEGEKLVDVTLKNKNRGAINAATKYAESFGVEGGQEMAQHASNIASQTFIDNRDKKNLDWLNSLVGGMFDGIQQTLTTKEGWEEGLVGGLTGGLFGLGHAKSERTSREARTAKQAEALNNIDWTQLTDKAQNYVKAINAFNSKEENITRGDLFEAKNDRGGGI